MTRRGDDQDKLGPLLAARDATTERIAQLKQFIASSPDGESLKLAKSELAEFVKLRADIARRLCDTR
jgi:hypothetical protein